MPLRPMPVRPTPLRPNPIRRGLAAAAAVTAVWALAGCGSHGSGTSADPATAVPASAPLYVGAFVRPGGSLKVRARAAGRALTHQANPYLRLLGLLQTPGSPALDYKRDVAPWLGERGAIFISSLSAADRARAGQLLSHVAGSLLGGSTAQEGGFPFGSGGVQGAIVLDTADATRARSFLTAQASRAGAHAASYRGVSYQATGGSVAFGVVRRFAVVGSEAALHAVVDTLSGGPALARAGAYAKLAAAAPAGALANAYADTAALSAGSQPGGGQGAGALLGLQAGGGQVNASLVPAANSLALDVDALAGATPAAGGGLLSASPEAASALGQLPGESWLGIGIANGGGSLGQAVAGLQALATLGGAGAGPPPAPSATLSVSGLLEALLTPLRTLGADTAQARRDFQSWMGPVGIFAAGSALLELKGAVVIASRDPARSRAAVAKLAAALRRSGGSVTAASIPGTEASATARLAGLPVQLAIAAGRAPGGQSKFVLGLGEASVQAALSPATTLASSPPYAAAASALGEGIQPSLTADFPTLLSLLEGVGLSEDPSVSPFVPYLRSLTTLSGGSKSLGGGLTRFRLVLGLTPAG